MRRGVGAEKGARETHFFEPFVCAKMDSPGSVCSPGSGRLRVAASSDFDAGRPPPRPEPFADDADDAPEFADRLSRCGMLSSSSDLVPAVRADVGEGRRGRRESEEKGYRRRVRVRRRVLSRAERRLEGTAQPRASTERGIARQRAGGGARPRSRRARIRSPRSGVSPAGAAFADAVAARAADPPAAPPPTVDARKETGGAAARPPADAAEAADELGVPYSGRRTGSSSSSAHDGDGAAPPAGGPETNSVRFFFIPDARIGVGAVGTRPRGARSYAVRA